MNGQVLPRKIILQSILIQLFIGAPFFSYFVFLLLGFHDEPGFQQELAARSPQERLTILHQWIALFSAAALFSCMGALVSHLSKSRNSNESITESFVLSLHVVGSIFGILLLLLFLGGFVAGNLFPTFDQVSFLTLHQNFRPINGWAKLFVWSFIAGFSERLVPDLLKNFTKELTPKVESKAESLDEIRQDT